MTEPIIQTKSLSKSFGQIHAVDSVDLTVPQKSIYAFLGPNGAGKTTTIRLLLGLIQADSGSINIFGQNSKTHRKTHARRIGSMVEGPSLYPHLNADELLSMAARLLTVENAQHRIDELLSLLNLQKARKRLIKTWSLGMKQRLGLAMALLSKPDLLILDEPTNGLDPAGIQEMRELLRNLPEKAGVTVFLSSHLLDEVHRVASHVGIIKLGKLIFQGSLNQLQQNSPGGLFIRVSNIDALKSMLVAKNIAHQPFQDGLLLGEVKKDEDVAAISRMVFESGMELYQMALHKTDMEQLFNQLTSDAAGEAN
jgi:ABC-type multidrug transport system ATPase subunit